MVEKLKEHDFEQQFDALLRELIGRVPFLKLTSLRKEARLSPDTPYSADRLAQVKAGDQKWTLIVEQKRLAQPREIRSAVLQLEHCLGFLPEDQPHYGVILAPFISEESRKICSAAGIGYADLAGNARLSFDQVFIETRGADNPFREKRETRSLFASRATRVLRTLLQGPLRPWKVTELAESARVSLGWVSAVRQQLLAREWAAEEPGGFRVTKPDELLDTWAKTDNWDKRTTIHEYSWLLAGNPEQLAEKLQETLSPNQLAFTEWIAGWLRHPYTTPPVITAYVKKFPEQSLIETKLLARRVSGDGRIRLVLPKDEGVFQPAQVVRGFNLVSDVQIYLDLLRAGQRGDEQAAELRKWPDFAGGWR
jgi:Transcriptional regulator, AbiEi antitoxin, Type IV TA system